MLYDIVISRCVLLHATHLLDPFHEIACASIENRELRGVHLDQAVVNLQCIQGGHGVFDGAYLYVVLL